MTLSRWLVTTATVAVVLGDLVVSCGRLRAAEAPAAASGSVAQSPDAAAGASERKGADEAEREELLGLFAETLRQVERNNIQGMTRRALVEAAIEGMLAKLDEHTRYIPPYQVDGFRADMESEFSGIGVRLARNAGPLTIVGLMPESPAARADLRPGDVITHIDSEKADGLTLAEALARLKGTAGTSVGMRVLRPSESREISVQLTRELVRMETVRGHRRDKQGARVFLIDEDTRIGYVWITAFGRHTARELRSVLVDLQARHMQGLVLDLRFNPGGLLTSAVDVADLFVPKGRIVSTTGRGAEEQVWEAHEAGTFLGFAIVVLVNQYTASASEVVAACLQDHRRGAVMGQRSYGKGSVQNCVELEGGRSALKLTTGDYRRPSGKGIDRRNAAGEAGDWGVQPNAGLEVPLSDAAAKHLYALRRALDAPTAGNAAEAVVRLEDKQLDRALAYLRQQLAQRAAATRPRNPEVASP